MAIVADVIGVNSFYLSYIFSKVAGGVNSVSYFSKVFKKKMGCLINEHKRRR